MKSIFLFLLLIYSAFAFSQTDQKGTTLLKEEYRFTLKENSEKANLEYASANFDKKKLLKFVFESEEPLSFYSDKNNIQKTLVKTDNKYSFYISETEDSYIIVMYTYDKDVQDTLVIKNSKEIVYYYEVIPQLKATLTQRKRMDIETFNRGEYCQKKCENTDAFLRVAFPDSFDIEIIAENEEKVLGRYNKEKGTYILILDYPGKHFLTIKIPGHENKTIVIDSKSESESYDLKLKSPLRVFAKDKETTVIAKAAKEEKSYSEVYYNGLNDFYKSTSKLFDNAVKNKEYNESKELGFKLDISYDNYKFNKNILGVKNLMEDDISKLKVFLNQIKEPDDDLYSLKENITFNLSWADKKVYFTKKADGSIISTNQFGKLENQVNTGFSKLTKAIEDSRLQTGTYGFNVLNKIVRKNNSEIEFKEITYIDNSYRIPYKTTDYVYAGLLPGYLDLKESKKNYFGWIKSISFASALLLCVSSKIYSDVEYNNYLNASDRLSSDRFYQNANLGQRIALISGGLALTIYSVDLYFSIKKILGLKNGNDSFIRKVFDSWELKDKIEIK